ncbi:MAG: hypothetical protein HY788_06190 [Deltaproteobacteria bacterium]|nr:hypothetical protein [Deltaproteobacteria bacterium]
MGLRVRFSDLFRCTLDERTGNEGYIGVSPKGDEYHVVVPVDTQIARGVKACNRPRDGTPFGGYARWFYFRCEAFSADGDPDLNSEEYRSLRVAASRNSGAQLVKWAAGEGIQIEVYED